MMSRRSMKYWRCSSASGVKDSLAKTVHRKSSIPGSRSENRNILNILYLIPTYPDKLGQRRKDTCVSSFHTLPRF